MGAFFFALDFMPSTPASTVTRLARHTILHRYPVGAVIGRESSSAYRLLHRGVCFAATDRPHEATYRVVSAMPHRQ